MEDYAFTLKFTEKTKATCTPSDYMAIIEDWQKRGIKIEVIKYEPDSKGVCHAHGILSAPKRFYFKKLKQVGLHYKIDPITDRKGWLTYINKNQADKPKTIKVISYKCLFPERDGLEEARKSKVCSTPEMSEDDSTPDGTEYIIRKLRRNIMRIV